MFYSCSVLAKSEAETLKSGISLSQTMYRDSAIIVLRGELGAGKTTFVQGFAEGLGIHQRITSPTYALEQRYGDNLLSHIDLYRLTSSQASDFFRTLDPFPGIRVIEWSDRLSDIEADIEIDITEQTEGRKIQVHFKDIPVPSDDEITQWMKTVGLPLHIQKHVKKVAEICALIADELLLQGRLVRKDALHAAALTHDLLRFVDFASLTGDAMYSPTPEETATWIRLKEMYGTPHEAAVEKFLIQNGFPEIGRMTRSHRGYDPNALPQTIEQYALAYADKRALIDTTVTLDQRFDDFIVRYGNGKESDNAQAWRREMKRIESLLFPEGVPF